MRYQFILHIDLSMISDIIVIRDYAPLSLPYKKKSFSDFAEGLFLIILRETYCTPFRDMQSLCDRRLRLYLPYKHHSFDRRKT